MRSLLVVIDLQKGWRHKLATEDVMLRTVELCRQFPGSIIHSRYLNDPGSLFHKQLGWQRFVESSDTDEIPEIAELGLPSLWRTTYSCLTAEFLKTIKPYGHIYIAGVFTDISVAATAMGLFDLNKSVSVVRDCVATLHGEDVQHGAIKSLEHAIGRKYVIDASEVLAQVSK